MLCHSILFFMSSLYNCLTAQGLPSTSLCLDFSVSCACPLSRETTRANKVKYFYYLQEVFFSALLASFVFGWICCWLYFPPSASASASASASLSYILLQRANKLQRLNRLCVLPLSDSLSVCLVSMPASGFHFKQNTIRHMRVIYAIYPPYICSCVCVRASRRRICHECQAKSRQIVGPFYVVLFCFGEGSLDEGSISHRKSEIMRRSWGLRHDARVTGK